MARSRIVKPEFFEDAIIGRMSVLARLLFIGMWTQADDAGNVQASPVFLKSRLFPWDEDQDSVSIHGALSELSQQGRIGLYEVGSEQYAVIVNFAKHQRINRPGKWRNPAPPTGYSVNAHGGLTERSVNDHGAVSDDSRMKSNPNPNPNPSKEADSLRSSGLPPAEFFKQEMRDTSTVSAKNGIAGRAFERAFNQAPNYGRLGAMAKRHGGPEAMLPLIFRIAPTFEGLGDAHDYLERALQNRQNGAFGEVDDAPEGESVSAPRVPDHAKGTND